MRMGGREHDKRNKEKNIHVSAVLCTDSRRIVMVYPLIWMVGATFKTNNEIFSSVGFIPKNPTLDGYKNAMKSYGGDIDLVKAMINTYSIVIPKVVFTIISATITAYGFARFEFKGKGILFAVLMSTLFLPPGRIKRTAVHHV